MGFFSIDGPVMKYMMLFADLVVLGILFLITSLPMLTIGPSITAMFYVATRRLYNQEDDIIKDYFKSFCLNFSQSLLVFTLLTVINLILCFNILFLLKNNLLSLDSMFGYVVCATYILLIIEIFFTSIYAYPIISRFELNFLKIIKMSFILANKHLPTTVCIFCLFLLTGYLTLIKPFICFLSPSVYALISSYFIMKVLKKYDPTIHIYEQEILK